MNKSPFLVARELVSPLQCEDMISRLKHTIPNTDQKGDPTVTYKGNRLSEMRVAPIFRELLPNAEKHFGFETKALTPFVFEWYPTGFSGSKATSEAYKLNKKRGHGSSWQKIKDYDFTVVVFLNDANTGLDFDSDFEVRGGKLEFPSHGFGFNPQRGTAVIFPSRSNFINAIAPVELGDLNLIRFQIIAKKEFAYNMDDFPGGYKEWFGE
jgi:hypothetical protein